MHTRTLFSTIGLVLASAPTWADPSVAKDVGVGLGVGVATGPNIQVMTSWMSHFDIGLGVDFDDRMRVQLDHGWRLIDFARSSPSLTLPFYVGIGGFVTDRRYGYADAGVRVPIGLQADFARAPLQLFGELSPELAVARTYDASMPPPPRDSFAVTGLVGVRAGF